MTSRISCGRWRFWFWRRCRYARFPKARLMTPRIRSTSRALACLNVRGRPAALVPGWVDWPLLPGSASRLEPHPGGVAEPSGRRRRLGRTGRACPPRTAGMLDPGARRRPGPALQNRGRRDNATGAVVRTRHRDGPKPYAQAVRAKQDRDRSWPLQPRARSSDQRRHTPRCLHGIRARAEFGHRMFATSGATRPAPRAVMSARTGTTRGS